jgi:hypothetical protein
MGMSIKCTGSDRRSYPDAARMLKAGVGKIVDEHFTKLELGSAGDDLPSPSPAPHSSTYRLRGQHQLPYRGLL